MTARINSQPDLTRPDVGAPMFSTWRVGTAERQQAAADAIAAAWGSKPWPTSALRSYSVFAGEDGDTLLHYSQWATEDDYHAFVRTQRQVRNDEIDAAVPGIERVELVRYRLYRSAEPLGGARPPGCFVAVTVDFDGPDPQRQQDWVDGVFDAASTDIRSSDGLIAAHFHLSADGTRVLNFAEWTSEQAHRDTVEKLPGSAVRSAARDFPGVKSLTFVRFRLLLHLANPRGA